MIATQRYPVYGRYSAFVERLLNGRCSDDCSTLLSRWAVDITNPLKCNKKPPKNLQASCKHVASDANAFRKQCERTNRWRLREDAVAQLGEVQSKP
jgi:hypothetical protein